MANGSEIVRAAGGIVWRGEGAAGRQVLVIHRPRYDDWSFPKGKNEVDESDEECARREVREETGLDVVLGPELPTVEYVDRRGNDKSVAYWTMTIDPDALAAFAFVPNDEVDEIRWMTVSEAAEALSYPVDRALVGELERVLAA